MGKISVFKFKNNSSDGTAYNIINEYLASRDFVYDNEKKAYIYKPSLDKKEVVNNVTGAVVTAILFGSASIPAGFRGSFGLEYYITNEDITIKAFTIDDDGYTDHLQSKFSYAPGNKYLNDLNENLFNPLKLNGYEFLSGSVEKIKDKKLTPVLKVIIGVGAALLILALSIIYIVAKLN